MNLTGMQIFKYLPGAKKAEGTNCKKCGFPTCMAYALKLAKKQADIKKCPHVPEDLKQKFTEASKIQQHEIRLSDTLITGGENVMYRHDKTFVHRTVIAAELDSEDKDFDKKLEKIAAYGIERIGEKFGIDAIYLTGGCLEPAAKKIEAKGIAVISQAAPYTIVTGGDITELEQRSKQAAEKGAKDIILELEYKTLRETAEQLTLIRRAAVIRRHEPLTYPVTVKLPRGLDPLQTTAAASVLICRYANILVLPEFDEALVSTLFTLRQNIYTNPQKPL